MAAFSNTAVLMTVKLKVHWESFEHRRTRYDSTNEPHTTTKVYKKPMCFIGIVSVFPVLLSPEKGDEVFIYN